MPSHIAEWGEPDIGHALESALFKAQLDRRMFGFDNPVRLGSFEVLRCIGRGSHGVVYEAHDAHHGGRVALKLLNHVDGQSIAALKHEFRVLAGITHPNLVALHELICERGHWFVSMELVQGVPFDCWLRGESDSVCDETTLRSVLGQLADAVSAIHASGNVHRDLKPRNVLVTTEGRVVVLDFGLTAEQGLRDTQSRVDRRWPDSTSELAGTPAYMAPELMDRHALSTASDWYAVGVMLFKVLTGRLPYLGDFAQVRQNKQRDDAPRVRELCSWVTPELERLCAALLCRDPIARAGAQMIRDWVGDAATQSSAVPNEATLPSERLVGRDAELVQLQTTLSAVQAGSGKSILISGLPGIGKTALMERFLASVPTATLVLRGRCHQQESLPYKVFDAVVDALSEALAKLPASEVADFVPDHIAALLRLFPVLERVPAAMAVAKRHPVTEVDERTVRTQAFDALKQLLAGLSRSMTLLIAIDDLQWGDVDSALVLGQVLGAPEPPRLLFVGTFRSDEAHTSPFLSRALRAHELGAAWVPTIMPLAALSREDAVALAGDLLRAHGIATTPELRRKLAQESAGVPFFMTELVQQVLRLQPSHASSWMSSGTNSLNSVIHGRVVALPDSAQRLLEVVSAAGRPLELRVALQAAGLPADERTSLSLLTGARLARMRGTRPDEALESYHDQVREVVVQALAPTALRSIHARLANTLTEHRIADPERLFLHWKAAGETQRAAACAVLAAQSAVAKLAFNRAAELFEHAIQLYGDETAHQQRLSRQLGDALSQAGRGAAAAAAYLVAARDADSGEARELRRFAARQYLRSGHAQEGLALARRVLEEVGIGVPRCSLLSVLWQRLLLRLSGLELRGQPRTPSSATLEALDTMGQLFPELFLVDGVWAVQLHARFLRTAIKLRDPERTLHGLVWEVQVASLREHKRDARRIQHVFEIARRLTTRVNTPYARAMCQLARSSQLTFVEERYADGSAAALSAEDQLRRECPGTAWEREMALFMRLICLEFTFEIELLSKLVREQLQEGREREDRFMMQIMLLSVPLQQMARDEPEAAWDFLTGCEDKLGPKNATFRYTWLVGSVEVLAYMGRAADGVLLMDSHWPNFRGSMTARSPVAVQGFYMVATRCLLSAYVQTNDAAYLHRAARNIRTWGKERTIHGSSQRAMQWALHMAEGSVHEATAALDAAVAEFDTAQCRAMSQAFARKRCELTCDSAGVQRIDDQMRSQGVRNPQRLAGILNGS